MTAITIFAILLLLLTILAFGSWGALSIHRRLVFLEREYHRAQLEAIADGQRLEKEILDLTARIEAAERFAGDANQRPLTSVNYTLRSQMLRMARRGDAAGQIASTLGVPLSQVRLLMKLPGAKPAPDGGKEGKVHAKAQTAGE